MRIAAIDIGTNSIHMIVVQIRPDLSFEVIDREKEMVRLGAGGLDGQALTEAAMASALQVLSKFRRLAAAHTVDEVVAAATSAVREATNGGEFLQAVAHATGIHPRVISGAEEARLIHLAAVYGVDVSGAVAVVVDIGGGSVELTRGTAAGPRLARSFKLGVIRLTERFVRSDPLSGRDERRLVRQIDAAVGPTIRQIVDAGFDRVIGTSGTILSLGAMAAAEQAGPAPEGLRNRRIPARQVHRLRKRIVELALDERLQLPGLEARRADLAVAGAVLLDTILKRLDAGEITLCDLSLREGLVLDYIHRHRRQIAQAERYPDVRRRSVIELAERCNWAPEHAQQVTRLALGFFRQTASVHGLDARAQEWLEFSALLHDIGVHISYPRHHKHSAYLIENGDLRGFEPGEVAMMALIARYHRRATPKKDHPGYRRLAPAGRRTVRLLAAMLRLAESLDRSHAHAIASAQLTRRGDRWRLRLRTQGEAELEVWAANRQKVPLERLIGAPIEIDVAPVPADGHRPPAAARPARTPAHRRRPATPAPPGAHRHPSNTGRHQERHARR
ncbi:MAG: Ppx/GppA family phosphatase [Acidobacteriota bacterium]|nr:Ppx/GppA family phosphatase [Acidobacteriota bacterium]